MIGILNLGECLTASMQILGATARQGYKLLDDRAQILGLGKGRLDLLMLDQGRSHVAPHRLAVSGCAVELAALITVTHDSVFLTAQYWSS